MSHTYAEPVRDRQRETASSDKQAETSVSSRPPVACSAPPGAPQGGLLDWFREKFSRQEQPDEGQQWEDNEYGEVNPAYVTDKPDAGSPLAPMVQNYTQEGPGQAPVFETHSFMPSASVDNESAIHLHSFIGLRFTQLDPVTSRYTRKRLKVGFGGGGKPVADHGTLMNDNNTQADMSSETPITRDQLESAMTAIPGKANEPYNVVTHNCNHFTRQLAEMVGASVPAQLHDTVLGPAGAYKNLANAAEEGQKGRTRFFQGGGMGSGRQSQMAGGQESRIITNFEDLAQSAARWDGLPFLLYPSLKNAAQQVAQAAAPMGRFLNIEFSIESPADANALETVTDTAAAKADELIKLHLWKGHPRVNITAMKVIAMAEQLHSTFLPEKRSITSYSQQELEASLHQRTKQEEDAQKAGSKTISNQSLFVFGNTSLTGAGDIFLQSMGLMPIDLIQKHSMGTGNPLVRCVALLRQVAGALTGEDGMGVNNYLISFFQGRENLSNAQLGALATQAMLDVLCQKALEVNSPLAHNLQLTRNNAGRIAADRDEDSLDNESNEYTRGTILNFTGKRNAPQNENQRSFQENKQHLLDLVNTMEATMAVKFEAVRARAAQTQTPQE